MREILLRRTIFAALLLELVAEAMQKEKRLSLPRPMTLIASKEHFALYEIASDGSEWRNFKLEQGSASGFERNYWLGWNGQRFSRSRCSLILQTYEPETFDWVVETIGGDPNKVRQSPLPAIPWQLKPKPGMTIVATKRPFVLYDCGAVFEGWRSVKLEIREVGARGRLEKRNWRLKWDGKRFAKGSDHQLLLKHKPDIYAWAINSLKALDPQWRSKSQPVPNVTT